MRIRFQAVFGIAILAMWSPGLSAQGTGHAFTYGVVSQSQLVNAVRASNCDRSIMRVTCDDFLAEGNRVIGQHIPGRSFGSRSELADYLATLDRRPCPVPEKAHLSRVLGTRVRANDNWEREFRPGEECLYDNNEAVFILALSCGNFVKSRHTVRMAMVPEIPAVTVPVPPSIVYTPAPQPLPPPTQVVIRRSNPWPAIIAVAAAGAVACAIWCRIRVRSDSESDSHARAAAFLGARLSF